MGWDRIKLDFHADPAVVFAKENLKAREFLGVFYCYIDTWTSGIAVKIIDILPEIANFS